jgi:hypothetical protein
MFGPPENIIDEIDGVIQWPVVIPPTITIIDMSGNVDLSGNMDLSGNTDLSGNNP